MVSVKKLMAAALIAGCGVLLANDYLSVLDKAENWINNTYKAGSLAHRRAKNNLAKIDETQGSETEKITKIKNAFPKAFQKEEKPLIFTAPVSWNIHSLALGYDIQESATQTLKAVDISKEIANRKISATRTQTEETQGKHIVDTTISGGNDFSLNPFSWLKIFTTKIKLSGSYAYGRESKSHRSELWSKSQQEMFAREREYISEMIQQTNIKNFHLTFTVSVFNVGKETLFCDLSDAYIPVYGDRKAYNITAKPYNMGAKILEIPPHRKKDITFRMELDNTNGRELAAYMAHNSPKIDILNGGQLRIRTQSGKDAIAEATQPVATRAVKLNLPEFSGTWNIRINHTSTGKFTTLLEALTAIGEDFNTAIGKTDIFQYNDGVLDVVSQIPFGKFAENDKVFRYIAFLQSGNDVYEQADDTLLQEKLPMDGYTVWVIDLSQLKDYKNIHPAIQKKIYEKIKAAAENSFWTSDKGNPVAQIRLAMMYEQGIFVKQDLAEAVDWYRKAAEQGDAWAQNNLGVRYFSGRGVPQDYTQAAEWYRKSADQGYARAQCNLGLCYDLGKGVEKDYTQAVYWYRKAAEQGDAWAQYMLGVCYYSGRGVSQDYTQAAEWYRKSADQGYAWAQYDLGTMYYRGDGVAKDYTQAVYWYRKAAEQGNAWAQYMLGLCYYNGRGVEKDYTEAVKWYRKSADQGYARAQYRLGLCYELGKGVEKDYTQAAEWYRKSADQGYAWAQYMLGLCYYNGRGVEKDYTEAVKWYRKSADQGYARAQCNLGLCYELGKGVEKDYTQAAEWYRKSADQGYAWAQYKLGFCYYYGIGVEKDYSQAVYWYRKAADQGHKAAKKALEDLE